MRLYVIFDESNTTKEGHDSVGEYLIKLGFEADYFFTNVFTYSIGESYIKCTVNTNGDYRTVLLFEEMKSSHPYSLKYDRSENKYVETGRLQTMVFNKTYDMFLKSLNECIMITGLMGVITHKIIGKLIYT